MRPSDITKIIIHCAATPPTMDIGAAEIDSWHRARGWNGCGYHGVIRRNGVLDSVEQGCRPMNTMGAHCRGYNDESIGVCLVGGVDEDGRPEDNFTPEQWITLAWLVPQLLRRFPGAEVQGHRDLNPNKACPSFDVSAWWAARRGA